MKSAIPSWSLFDFSDLTGWLRRTRLRGCVVFRPAPAGIPP
ncbi:MAG: hypothetical protein WAQ05_23965 [Rubrivivax sp.]